MISNERHFSSFRPAPQPPYGEPRPPVMDETIKTSQLLIERKVFFLALKENARGRFVRISENSGGRRNSIVIPTTGLNEILKLLHEMADTPDKETPKETPK